MITRLDVQHYEIATNRSFEDVMHALDAATGSVEEGFANIAGKATDRADFTRIFSERAGTSGFMRFQLYQHGSWLARFYGIPFKATMVILGNPLLAYTMLRHDLRAGLNVPIRIFIYEGASQEAHIVFDLPSSLMANLSAPARDAAAELDSKLLKLIGNISGQTII